MTAVTLSSKNQVVIPKEARDALDLKPGKRLLVHVEGDMLIMHPEPKNYVKAMRGLHKEVWEGIDTDGYLRGERDSWDDN
ncbi:MAG: AbrB/MazE/SpoVT family DNA-binding domain-containing protein [Gammaproteobacteria bacterium]|nr:AbrB/MazE/SpoVT family DNA-binding domain-containing protein [Gammaproteobacteria bacterium]NNJ84436.1 AbrB/MazE/SpoVT family DNA-binding domain-containing protein [Gammaproteobacteria bacterium]